MIQRVRRALARVLRGLAARVDADDDVVSISRRRFVYGERSRHLLIEKNRYVLRLRDGGTNGVPTSHGEVVRSNDRAEFDRLWGSPDLVLGYLAPVRLAFFEEVASAAHGFLQGSAPRILDVGCGTGHFLGAYARLLGLRGTPGRCVGADFSAPGMRLGRSAAPSASFVQAAVDALPFPDDCFDQVTCLETLEHLEQPRAAVDELMRVVRPGACVVITVPDGDVDDYLGHVNFWTRDQFRRFCAPHPVLEARACSDGVTSLITLRKRRDPSP